MNDDLRERGDKIPTLRTQTGLPMEYVDSTKILTLVVALGLLFGCAQATAKSRVVEDQITEFNQAQVVAALKSAMEKEGCHIEAEKTYKGSGIQEIKCIVGEEKVTAQVSHEHFAGSSLHGERIDRDYISLWLKTSGGKTNWSTILDKETMDILRKRPVPN